MIPIMILQVDEHRYLERNSQNEHLFASIFFEFIVNPDRLDPKHKKRINLRK